MIFAPPSNSGNVMYFLSSTACFTASCMFIFLASLSTQENNPLIRQSDLLGFLVFYCHLFPCLLYCNYRCCNTEYYERNF
nr:MAG TPA: hypothetical protein [Caudoviricetes sp.]